MLLFRLEQPARLKEKQATQGVDLDVFMEYNIDSVLHIKRLIGPEKDWMVKILKTEKKTLHKSMVEQVLSMKEMTSSMMIQSKSGTDSNLDSS